jgi:adenylate cyclase
VIEKAHLPWSKKLKFCYNAAILVKSPNRCLSVLAAPTPRRKAAAGAFIALVAYGLALVLALVGVLTPYSLKTLDLLFRITPLPPASPEVVVVTVDQPDLDFLKQQGVSWPWPRQLYAPIIEFCRRGGARAVVLDILYTEASVYGADDDQRLAEAMKASGFVTLPFVLTREPKTAAPETEEALARASLAITGPPPPNLTVYQGVTPPIPPLLTAAAALGNVECSPDPDGIYRRLPLVGVWQGRFLPLLSFSAFCRFQEKGEWRFAPQALVRGDYRVPLDREGRVLLKFRGPGRSFQAPQRRQYHPVGDAPAARPGALLPPRRPGRQMGPGGFDGAGSF